MKLEKLPRITTSKKKRVGRGYGSGKGGHTVGRGAKGNKARGKIGLTFMGTKAKKSFIKRLPFQRGKGKFKTVKKRPIIVNLKFLNLLPPKTVVDLESLIKYRIIKAEDAQKFGVKILGDGEVTKPLTINLPISEKAGQKVKKAGGVIGEPFEGKSERPKAVAKVKPKTSKKS